MNTLIKVLIVRVNKMKTDDKITRPSLFVINLINDVNNVHQRTLNII